MRTRDPLDMDAEEARWAVIAQGDEIRWIKTRRWRWAAAAAVAGFALGRWTR